MNAILKPVAGDILFISDVHLGGFTKEKNDIIEQDLVALLKFANKNALKIIVLGDLFDYWMEYKNTYPIYADTVLNAFKVQNELVKSLLITGNHDCWTRSKLEETGFEVEHEYRIVNLGDAKCLLLHGDGLKDPCMKLKRSKLSRIIRSRAFLLLYQFIFPPKLGFLLMSWFSRFSKKYQRDALKKSEFFDNWAIKKLEDLEIDVVIAGHFHIHKFIYNSNGLYINLGAFFKHRTVGIYTKNRFNLVRWCANEEAFYRFEIKE